MQYRKASAKSIPLVEQSIKNRNLPRMMTYQIYISGKVQGVFFRASTQAKAQELGLTGYVENLPDGRVHAIISGTDSACLSLIHWCQQGSPQAQVEAVEAHRLKQPQTFSNFSIRR